MRIHPRVTQVRTHFDGNPVELYFIKGERNVVVDTGTTQSPQNDITPTLNSFGLTLSDMDLILNTHGHFDHTAGNAAIKIASNAQVLIHGDDAVFVEDHQCCFKQYFAPAVEAIRGREFLVKERRDFFERAGTEVTVDRKLRGKDLIELGDGIELRVIHLPGHTSGSVGFYWEKEGILFSGDSAPGLHVEGGSLPVIWDLARYEKSLEYLKGIPFQLLLCAHHYRGLNLPPSAVRSGDEVRQYLGDCQEAAKRIGEAIRHVAPQALGKPFMEVADAVMAKLPKKMGFTRPMELQSLYCAMTIFFHLSRAN